MNKPTKTPIMLSAIMSPGAGQFLQRRWIAGSIYLTAFLLCMIVLLVEIIRPMVANIIISIDFAAHVSDQPLVQYRVIHILAWFGLALAVYLAGLLDTWTAYTRQCREWSRQHSRLGEIPKGY